MSRGWSTAKQASVLPLILFCLGGGGEEHWLFLLCSYTSTLLEAITFLWLGFAKENRIKHFSSAFLTHSSSYRTLPEKPVFSENSSSPSQPSARADTSQRHQHSFARSELCLCRLYNALTPKKSFKKGEKNPRRKKTYHTPPTCYGFQTMAHVSIQKYEKATGKELLGNILFPDFSKRRSQVLAGVFYDCMFSSCACHQQTNLPGPCISPGLRAEGTPLALRWVTVPSQLFCHFASFRTFRVTNTLNKQLLWVHTENIPNSAQEQEQSSLFHP